MEKWKSFINHGISVLNRNHGGLVKEFYESIGINTDRWGFNAYKKQSDYHNYYIDENGVIDNVSDSYVLNYNIKIVTLEEAIKLVGNNNPIENIISLDADVYQIKTKKISGKVVQF